MQFTNATVVKKANVYFDGKVTSRTVISESGDRVTLGFMLPGTYTFRTDAPEKMQVLAGEARVRLPGEDAEVTYGPETAFCVPGNSSFEISIDSYLDYCCSYGAQ